MAGYIQIDRKILKWEWYQDVKVFHLFLYFILRANWEDGRWKGIEVKRGQLITGRLQLSKDTGLSERSIRTCLEKLKTTGELTIKATSKYSIVTICKYDVYQKKYDQSDQHIDQHLDQQTTNKRPTNDQQTTTNNNSINNNKEERRSIVHPKILNEMTIVGKMKVIWMKHNPGYQIEEDNDCPALLSIAYKIAKAKGWEQLEVMNGKLEQTTQCFEIVAKFVRRSDFYKKLELTTINKQWSGLYQSMSAAVENDNKGQLIKTTVKTEAQIRKEMDDWNNSEF